MSAKQIAKDIVCCILLRSLRVAASQQKLIDMDQVVSELSIDLSKQYSEELKLDEYTEKKIKYEHAFQIGFTLDAIKELKDRGEIGNDCLSVVDIGDSAGTHLSYLKFFLKDSFGDIDAVSVNLDPIAVEKIRARGGAAVLCRAEEYSPEKPVSLYLTFEMMEHLHNPALFFHNLALADNGQYMVVTVPYVKSSRVSCIYMNDHTGKDIHAESVHIFELSPEDWEKIALHSGWRIIRDRIYLQYPKCHIFTPFYRWLWRRFDFEGFFAMFLVRDMTQADRYLDWE